MNKLRSHFRNRNMVLAASWLAIAAGWYTSHPMYIGGAWALLNVYVFSLMNMDKRAARRGISRIPEKSLLLLAVLGGAAGLAAGMFLFRHKTRHAAFLWGGPFFLLVHILLLSAYILR